MDIWQYMYFRDHLGLCTILKPSYLGSIVLVSVWCRMGSVDPNKNSGVHRFSELHIPTKYQYLTGITILIPMGRFFHSIIDVDYLYPCIHLHTDTTLVWATGFLVICKFFPHICSMQWINFLQIKFHKNRSFSKVTVRVMDARKHPLCEPIIMDGQMK